LAACKGAIGSAGSAVSLSRLGVKWRSLLVCRLWEIGWRRRDFLQVSAGSANKASRYSL